MSAEPLHTGPEALRVVALAGGVGAARFLEGLVQVVEPARVTAVVNTGDDAEFHGLQVSPDVDIVLYTLAGLVDPDQGWGIQEDSFHTLEMLGRYGQETWFRLGDRDLATHIYRTKLSRQGTTPGEVTEALRRHLGVEVRILPMSDQPVRTEVRTPDGWLAFQDYFVKRRAADDVHDIRFAGIEAARPGPGVLDAIERAEIAVLCPSNPLVSIGTILAVPGIRETFCRRTLPVVAVSPIVGGTTIKGPADRMMRGLGMEVSPVGIAEAYREFLDVLVLDEQDRALCDRVEALGIRAVVTDTIMRDASAKARLAEVTLRAAGPR